MPQEEINYLVAKHEWRPAGVTFLRFATVLVTRARRLKDALQANPSDGNILLEALSVLLNQWPTMLCQSDEQTATDIVAFQLVYEVPSKKNQPLLLSIADIGDIQSGGEVNDLVHLASRVVTARRHGYRIQALRHGPTHLQKRIVGIANVRPEVSPL